MTFSGIEWAYVSKVQLKVEIIHILTYCICVNDQVNEPPDFGKC